MLLMRSKCAAWTGVPGGSEKRLMTGALLGEPHVLADFNLVGVLRMRTRSNRLIAVLTPPLAGCSSGGVVVVRHPVSHKSMVARLVQQNHYTAPRYEKTGRRPCCRLPVPNSSSVGYLPNVLTAALRQPSRARKVP